MEVPHGRLTPWPALSLFIQVWVRLATWGTNPAKRVWERGELLQVGRCSRRAKNNAGRAVRGAGWPPPWLGRHPRTPAGASLPAHPATSRAWDARRGPQGGGPRRRLLWVCEVRGAGARCPQPAGEERRGAGADSALPSSAPHAPAAGGESRAPRCSAQAARSLPAVHPLNSLLRFLWLLEFEFVSSLSPALGTQGPKKGPTPLTGTSDVSLCLSWDSALARGQERRSFGAPFSLLLSRPQPDPPSRGLPEAGGGPYFFLWRCYLSFGLSAFLSYEISIWGPCLPHPHPRDWCFAMPSPSLSAKEGKSCTRCRCLQELLFWPSCSCPPPLEKIVGGSSTLPSTLDCTGPQRPGLGWCRCFSLGGPRLDSLKP